MAKGSAGGGDRHPQASIAGVVLLRFFLGFFFLYVAAVKLMHPQAFIDSLHGVLAPGGQFVTGDVAWPAFTHFLKTTVYTHLAAWAWLIMLGEGMVGVLFLLGFLTRLAALGGLALSTAYLLSTLHLTASDWGVNAAFVAMNLAVLIAAAGRTWGLDALLARRTRVKLLW